MTDWLCEEFRRPAYRLLRTLVLLVLSGLIPPASRAMAGDPAGTIACDLQGRSLEDRDNTGISFSPYLTDVSIPRRIYGSNVNSTCDSSGVTGSNADIVGVRFDVRGQLLDADCSSPFGNALSLQGGKIRLKWRGIGASGAEGAMRRSKAVIDQFSYDEGSGVLTIVSGPITSGPFTGETATLGLSFVGAISPEALAGCQAGSYGFSLIGMTSVSSLVVE